VQHGLRRPQGAALQFFDGLLGLDDEGQFGEKIEANPFRRLFHDSPPPCSSKRALHQ
jgi:hypothetical protein